MATTGVRMQNRRVELGLTLDEVADQVSVSPQYLSALELGKNAPPAWDLIVELSNLYGVSTDYLLGKGQPTELNSEHISELTGVFSNMSSRRQKDLLTIAAAFRRLDSYTSSDRSDEIDPSFVALYNKLALAGRLDLLKDAGTELLSERENNNGDINP